MILLFYVVMDRQVWKGNDCFTFSYLCRFFDSGPPFKMNRLLLTWLGNNGIVSNQRIKLEYIVLSRKLQKSGYLKKYTKAKRQSLCSSVATNSIS